MTRSLFPFFSRLTRHSLTFPACFCRSFSRRSMPSTPVGSEPGAASPRNTATLVSGQSNTQLAHANHGGGGWTTKVKLKYPDLK